ncbi:unnamed protein product [Bursaphelenchus xylophilus]|uniref:(pine wood nematode) hypothetical protein n=1 Tax=Bursaphelenchus xylophilus TaxID=6326 RepID=A0A1I7SC84_BURXY|nr:unnamed protein product [Bursaphelenchus xylophilus]CAG9094571.1 unnamed protein product [Bursaphelenchus xylophilus]
MSEENRSFKIEIISPASIQLGHQQLAQFWPHLDATSTTSALLQPQAGPVRAAGPQTPLNFSIMSPIAKDYPLTLKMSDEDANLIRPDIVLDSSSSSAPFSGRKRPSSGSDEYQSSSATPVFHGDDREERNFDQNTHQTRFFDQNILENRENWMDDCPRTPCSAGYPTDYGNVQVKQERNSPESYQNPRSDTPNDPNYSPRNPPADGADFGQTFEPLKPEPHTSSPRGFSGYMTSYYGEQPSSSASFEATSSNFEQFEDYGYASTLKFEDFSTPPLKSDENQVDFYMNLSAVKEESGEIEEEEDDEDAPSSSYMYGEGKVCTVCGYKCPHKNYGVYCCNACAAFFRRTIKQSRSYVCVKGRKCRVDFGGHKRTCRYCRFKRCVMAGMSIDYVMTRADDFMIDSAPDNDIIKQISSWFTSTFVNRFRSFEKSFSNGQGKVARGEGTLNNTLHSMFVEFDVMRTYLNTTGLRRYIKEKDEVVLTKRLFYKWLFVQCVFNTLRHGGHRQNRVYMVDDSSLPLEAKFHEQYVMSIPTIKNPKIVAASHYNLIQQGMDDVWMFHHANVDGNDFAIFNHLICLRTIREMYPQNKEIQTEMNSLFKASHQYYKSVFKDFPTRMGNLVLLMNESEVFTLKFKEWVVLMTLSGVRSALQQIEDHWVAHGNYNVCDVSLSYMKRQ